MAGCGPGQNPVERVAAGTAIAKVGRERQEVLHAEAAVRRLQAADGHCYMQADPTRRPDPYPDPWSKAGSLSKIRVRYLPIIQLLHGADASGGSGDGLVEGVGPERREILRGWTERPD